MIETYRYSGFGVEIIFNRNENPKDNSINPWRFASKRTDHESGLVYFGRRYYSSGIGRWITQDPLGPSAGPNLYAYVMNSPLFHLDLYGLDFHRVGDRLMSDHMLKDSGYNYKGLRDHFPAQPRVSFGTARCEASWKEIEKARKEREKKMRKRF